MKLITKEIEQKAPALYATENVWPKRVAAKFFTPDSNWTWYMVEYDPSKRMAFGLVDGHEKEWGYFSIDELEAVRGPWGLKVERDRYFGDKSIDSEGRLS